MHNGKEIETNWFVMSSIDSASKISFSDASTINEEKKSSTIVERNLFFTILTLLMARLALQLDIAKAVNVL